jgi:hypothetical protein
MLKVCGTVVAVLLISACSHPCHDYCEDFVKRTQECGLGGPSGDSEVDQCGDQVEEVLTDDACSNADDQIKNMSCENFKAIVCAQSNASSTYKCD